MTFGKLRKHCIHFVRKDSVNCSVLELQSSGSRKFKLNFFLKIITLSAFLFFYMHGILLMYYIRPSNLLFSSTDSISFSEHFRFSDTRGSTENRSTLSLISKKWTFPGHKIDTDWFSYSFNFSSPWRFRLAWYEKRQKTFTVLCLQKCNKIAITK